MKILLTSDHIYPAYPSIHEIEAHTYRNTHLSYSSRHLQDLTAKGLGELGHEVFYWLPEGAHRNIPKGVTIVTHPPEHIEVAHLLYNDLVDGIHDDYFRFVRRNNIPWVGTRHLVEKGDYDIHKPCLDNLVFVSKFAAQTFGRQRFIHNGIDPNEFLFQKDKEGYFFFISALELAERKGLNIALELSQKMGFKLVIAGNVQSKEFRNYIVKKCKSYGAEYVGPAYGMKKAALFAGARGVLFPSLLRESFGLVAIEAMLSGTPIIASDNGALPEIISPEVGFICRSESAYEQAIENVSNISTHACREKGILDYHYLKMAKAYLKAYQAQIKKSFSTSFVK